MDTTKGAYATNILHIYGQSWWHEEVYIVGSKQALQKLAAAINKATTDGSCTHDAIVNDGEGFDVNIICENNAEKLDKLAVPYMSETAREKREHAILPWGYIANPRGGD